MGPEKIRSFGIIDTADSKLAIHISFGAQVVMSKG